jgi:hypothetical protein
MSARKNQTNLNLSGFSPIQRNYCFINCEISFVFIVFLLLVNTNSPSSYKSPGKDYGINERIEAGRERLVSGYDRWNLATANGFQCITIINSVKEKARRSNESVYPAELENYCKKMEAVRVVLEEVIKSVKAFRKEIAGSVAILESMRDNEELKMRLETVRDFVDCLLELYEASFVSKCFVLGELAT